MRISPLSLLIVAFPPILGSFVVLALAAVGNGVWITHLLAISVGCCLIFLGSYLSMLGSKRTTALTLIVLTLLGLAAPLLGDGSSGPERWIGLGPLRMYVAPLFLPSFIAACSIFIHETSRHRMMIFAAVIVAAFLLASQPDASQILGLTVASAVVVVRGGLGVIRLGVVALPLVAVTFWTFSLPDPLNPIPHVEGVFALALDHSLFAGSAVIFSAAVLIVGLWVQSFSGPFWLSAVASYYLVLFVCSTTGITPAPLVGYGSGPIIGFGLMAGLLGRFELLTPKIDLTLGPDPKIPDPKIL